MRMCSSTSLQWPMSGIATSPPGLAFVLIFSLFWMWVGLKLIFGSMRNSRVEPCLQSLNKEHLKNEENWYKVNFHTIQTFS